MKIFQIARLPLLTLVLLATLLVTGSAFAAAPVVKQATHKVFPVYNMESAGGDCPYSHMSSFSADDD